MPGLRQRHLKVVLGTGVTLDKHVVRLDTQFHLRLPHLRPVVGFGIDVVQQRALATDMGAGFTDARHRLTVDIGFHLAPVVVVRHEGQVLAGGDDVTEQRHQIIAVLISDKAVRPEGQRLGTDTDGTNMVELRFQQWFQVGTQVLGLHHHGIAPGDQDIGHFRMFAQVVAQLTGFLGRNLQ